MLILPGGPGGTSHYMEASDLSSLAQSNVLVFTEPVGSGTGGGRSEKGTLEDYTLSNQVENLERIREALGIEQWTIIGHSGGAVAAAHYAVHYPQRTGKLILLSDGASGTTTSAAYQHILDYWRTQKPAVWARMMELRAMGQKGTEHSELGYLVGQQWPGFLYSRRPEAYPPGQEWGTVEFMGVVEGTDSPFNIEQPDDEGTVRDLGIPTMVVGGDDDGVFTPTVMAAVASSVGALEYHSLPDTGHNVHMEAGPQTVELIRQFLGNEL
ncbi:MAG: alpha/beta fold hydrolase [Kofleriaceae bacterium]